MTRIRDITYCINDECKTSCFRKLTEEVKKELRETKKLVSICEFPCVDYGEDNETKEMS